ncbi:hypothetical protein D1007_50302 [Hordeum vulgare]|uniref:DUF295 domain-containing protein n=1 Tax=Hordeum vulgare subsp. vulgare TaxID=112509 RepID=A0A8I6Z162_HORVV|nr:hypothetical protein D1007_50302 [Hordeum vulgare]
MAEDEGESGWAHLPDDLLLQLLRRLASFADRVRAAAVYRPWRSAASQLPPSRLPWVAFGNGTLLDLANDGAPHPHHRRRLPDDCWRYSAGENMLFLVHQRDGSCSLLNALSGATTRLPELAGLLRTYDVEHRHRERDDELRRVPHNVPTHDMAYNLLRLGIPHNLLRHGIPRSSRRERDRDEPPMKAIGKVVVSSSASGGDDDPIVAVLLERDIIVSTCRPAGESNSLLLGALRHDAVDMAVFQGKIYALSKRSHALQTIDLSNGHRKGFKLKYSTELIEDQWLDNHHHQDFHDDNIGVPTVEMYLLESGGKLLMVKRWLRGPWRPCIIPDADGRRTFRLEVWEADLRQGRWRWNKLDGGLDGRALFVSRPCSKSLPAGHGVRGDCIYFLNKLYQWKQPEAPLGDSGVYSIRDKAFTPLLCDSEQSLPWKNGRFPSWFFHVQA